MLHPDYGVALTDRLGREINVDDLVLVPVRNRTHVGGGKLIEARIVSIDPLFERPGTWVSTGLRSRVPYVRVSQVNHKKPTEYYPPCLDPSDVVDLSKASVLSVQTPTGDRISIRFNDCVKVV
jgi:hypothetical protein